MKIRRSNFIWNHSFGGDIVTNNPFGFQPFDIYYNPMTYERIFHTDTCGNITDRRTSFSNHAFAMLGDNVYDACALTLGLPFADYLITAIDTSTPAEAAVAGTAANKQYGHVTIALP